MLVAVILAAGESRRMGFPKALLPYQGRTFLEHLLAITENARIGARRVVIGAHQQQITEQVKRPSTDWVVNQEWQKGQLSSIRAAINSLEAVDTEGIVVFLVDHPFVTTPVLDALLDAFDRSPGAIVIPSYRNRRGHPVIFPSSLFPELRSASDDLGARAVVWAHAKDVVEVPTQEEGVLVDIDDRVAFEKHLPSHSAEPFPHS